MKISTRSFFYAILALVLSLSPVAQAKETPQQIVARKAIVAAYARGDSAAVKRDITTFMSIFASDFQNYDRSSRPENRAQFEAEVRYVFASPVRVLKSSTKLISLTWRGRDAVAVTQNTMVFVSTNGLNRRFESVTDNRDYWSLTARGWQVRQSVTRDGTSWVNGKRTQ